MECVWEDCNLTATVCGYCRKHYKAARRCGALHLGKYERDHPLYAIWWQRRKDGNLGLEWTDNFRQFVIDVGERKDKNHFLVRLRDEPYGPTNFVWREHLRRKDGEPLKKWYARKWQARKNANPGWDNNRRIQKKYGITREQYNEKFAAQNGLCSVCGKPETEIEYKTGKIRALAIDHCHYSGQNRNLLCRRCNSVLGIVDDSIELLDAMKAYLIKWKT